jgi:hypothetical protein
LGDAPPGTGGDTHDCCPSCKDEILRQYEAEQDEINEALEKLRRRK